MSGAVGSHELDAAGWDPGDYWIEERDAAPECQCGRATIGETCGQCGQDLCPMCFETGAGFCSAHPDENFQPEV